MHTSKGLDAETLRSARGHATTAFLEFVLLSGRDAAGVFCFVEGEDERYYLSRIEQHCEGELSFIRCNGKSEVKGALRLVSAQPALSDVRTLYLTDRDFDPPSGNPAIFVTPCYSVENLYTSAKAFARILHSEFSLSRLDSDFDRTINLYRDRQREFHKAMLLANAWIWCVRDMEREGCQSRLDLGNLSLKKLVSVDLSKVKGHYALELLESLCPGAAKVYPKRLADKMAYLSTIDPQKTFRGKFEIEFMRLFLAKLLEDRSSDAPRFFTSKGPVKLSISSSNILTELSGYAETPACLKKYVRSRAPIAS